MAAVEEGHVDTERATIKVIGRDRVGKTCFVDSLADNEFTVDRHSTETVSVKTLISWKDVNNYKLDEHLDKILAKEMAARTDSGEQTTSALSLFGQGLRHWLVDIPLNGLRWLVSRVGRVFGRETGPAPGSARNEVEAETDDDYESVLSEVSLSDQDEKRLTALVTKFREDEGVMRTETDFRVMHVWDFPGQPLFWMMLSCLLLTQASPNDITFFMLLFDLSRPLSDRAKESEYSDAQHGLLACPGPFDWIKTEGDFIGYLLMMLHIAGPNTHSGDLVRDVGGVLLPAVFAVGTHAGEKEAQDILEEQKIQFGKILDTNVTNNCDYRAHVIKPGTETEVDSRFFCVDNKKSGTGEQDSTVVNIRHCVDCMCTEFWNKLGSKHRRVPLKFVRLEKVAYKLVGFLVTGMCGLAMLRRLARDVCRITSEEEFILALKFLTSLAVLFYFPDVAELNQFVIIDPAWLFKVVCAFVSAKKPVPPILENAWKKLESSGVMSGQLAVHLLKECGVKESQYVAVLQLLRWLGIASSLDEVDDEPSTMSIESRLFVPCRIISDTPREWSGLHYEKCLPPPLIFRPDNVGHFPEPLFVHFITYLAVTHTVHDQNSFQRDLYRFPLGNNLQLEVRYHQRRYVIASLSTVSGGPVRDRSVLAPFCSSLRVLLCEKLHNARQLGMAGFQFDTCFQLHPTYDGVADLQPDELVSLKDYSLDPNLAILTKASNGDAVHTDVCPSLSMWFHAKTESQTALNCSPDQFFRVVISQGVARWYSIGCALGFGDGKIQSLTSDKPSHEDKLLAIINSRTNDVGEERTCQELYDACRTIPRPILEIVMDALKKPYKS